jgi:hypothetical protein
MVATTTAVGKPSSAAGNIGAQPPKEGNRGGKAVGGQAVAADRAGDKSKTPSPPASSGHTAVKKDSKLKQNEKSIAQGKQNPKTVKNAVPNQPPSNKEGPKSAGAPGEQPKKTPTPEGALKKPVPQQISQIPERSLTNQFFDVITGSPPASAQTAPNPAATPESGQPAGATTKMPEPSANPNPGDAAPRIREVKSSDGKTTERIQTLPLNINAKLLGGPDSKLTLGNVNRTEKQTQVVDPQGVRTTYHIGEAYKDQEGVTRIPTIARSGSKTTGAFAKVLSSPSKPAPQAAQPPAEQASGSQPPAGEAPSSQENAAPTGEKRSFAPQVGGAAGAAAGAAFALNAVKGNPNPKVQGLALIGGGIVGGFGGSTVADQLFGSKSPVNWNNAGNALGGAVVGGSVGGAPGAVVGGLVGSQVDGWGAIPRVAYSTLTLGAAGARFGGLYGAGLGGAAGLGLGIWGESNRTRNNPDPIQAPQPTAQPAAEPVAPTPEPTPTAQPIL